MTSKFYSKLSIVAIVAVLMLLATVPVMAETVYLPLVIGGASEQPEDSSTGDGTCLFWRSGNAIWLSIYVSSSQSLYVVSSSEREDEPYVISIYPHSVQVGEIDSNGESITGYTQYLEDGRFVRDIRCDAQFAYQ